MSHSVPPLDFEVIAEQCSLSLPLPSELPALWEQAQAILSAPEMEVVIKRFGVELRPDTFVRILHGDWLDGDGIDSYIRSVASWQPQPQGKMIHVLNSCLWVYLGKLSKEGFDRAKRIFKKSLSKISHGSLILSPVCMHSHWTLIALDLETMRLDYYDSMGGMNSAGINIFLELLRDVGIVKRVEVTYPQNIPLQKPGDTTNCGVFVCRYAKAIIEGRHSTLTQEDITTFRRTIALTILQQPASPSPQRFQDYRDWCGISGQDYEETVEAEDPVDWLNQKVMTDQYNQDMRNISDVVDQFSFREENTADRIRASNIPKYRPTYGEHESLRNQDQPYVDINENGYEYTANANGDWRKCLRLAEVLELISKDEDKAWSILELEISSNPTLVLTWLANSEGKDKLRGPTSFRFGKRCHADKVRSMLMRTHPGLGTFSPKSKRGSVRTSAQRRERKKR